MDKNEVFAIPTKARLKLKCLMTYIGGEYISSRIKDFCAKNGIKRDLTNPNNPTSNGVAEQYNRGFTNCSAYH